MQPIARQRICKHAQYATIKEAVFFVMQYPFLGYISKTELVHGSYVKIAMGSRKLAERIETRSKEEYRRSACEDLKCDCKILCVIFVVICSDSFCVEICC
jgi:hypothetical protein